jgi:hypothetical protein
VEEKMSKIADAQHFIVDACHLFSVIGFATGDVAEPSQPLCAAVNAVARIGEDKLIEAMKLLDHEANDSGNQTFIADARPAFDARPHGRNS